MRRDGPRWGAAVVAAVAAAACAGEETTGESCALLAGDLVVSELMVDPLGDESAGEWLELYNATGANQVLDRVVVRVSGNKTQEYELRGVGTIGPREYFVAGNGPAASPHLDLAYGGALDLPNGGAALVVSCEGRAIDAVSYGGAGGPSLPPPGWALGLDGEAAPDALANDHADAWCAGAPAYDGTSHGTPGDPNPSCHACQLSPGDLVVSELLIDPLGDEASGEWLEIYNAAGATVELGRLVVVVSGTTEQRHELWNAGSLDAGAYFVLGNGAAGTHLDYAYGGALELGNSGATVRLECGGMVVDTVAYGSAGGAALPGAGRSLGLDGGIAPDAALNDAPESWCAGSTPYDGASLGTPGSANRTCGMVTCEEAGLERPIAAPLPGQLVVSEVLADVEGSEEGKEWLEVFASAAADFNGLAIEVENVTTGTAASFLLAGPTCLPAEAGRHVVIGGSADPSVTGGVPVDFVVPGFTLPSAAVIEVRLLRGGVELDAARVPFAPAGVSVRLDDSFKDAAGNDLEAAFCEAAASQDGAFGRGTPGAENGLCGTLSCRDGEVRPSRAPAPGEVVVTEVFAESSRPAIAGGGRDWLELYVAGDAAVDLNGLSVEVANAVTGRSSRVSLASESCVSVSPGSYAVVACATDPQLTGGVVARIAAPGLGIFNDPPLVVSVWSGGLEIDEAHVPPAAPGRSASLRPQVVDAAANDDEAAFCYSEATLVFDERGTPGLPNLCGPLCTEAGVQRQARAPGPGSLVLTEVVSDAAGATSGTDWLEARAAAGLDLNGLVVNAGSGRWTLPGAPADTCLPVPAGGYVVVGGASVAEAMPGATIGGASDTLFPANPTGSAPVRLWLEHRGTLVDEVYYPQADDPVRPLAEGSSFSLDPDATGSLANDAAESWCVSAEPTPAVANALQCG